MEHELNTIERQQQITLFLTASGWCRFYWRKDQINIDNIVWGSVGDHPPIIRRCPRFIPKYNMPAMFSMERLAQILKGNDPDVACLRIGLSKLDERVTPHHLWNLRQIDTYGMLD